MRTHRNCIFIVAVAAVLLSSSLSIGASVEVTGDFKLNGAGSGVVFPDGTVQTTAAAPTWHQILPVAERFMMVMNNNAVLDMETGLVWERSPGDTDKNGVLNNNDRLDWSAASYFCTNLALGNRKGWRLPTIQELASLVDPSVPLPGPALPAGHPFSNVQSSLYWSASSVASTGDAADLVFVNGTVASNPKSYTAFVWCVRGGQGIDPM